MYVIFFPFSERALCVRLRRTNLKSVSNEPNDRKSFFFSKRWTDYWEKFTILNDDQPKSDAYFKLKRTNAFWVHQHPHSEGWSDGNLWKIGRMMYSLDMKTMKLMQN